MDTSDLSQLLEQLEDQIDELEGVLSPILGYSLSKVSSNLPLMDKAKFFSLVSYSVESLIFCMPLDDCLAEPSLTILQHTYDFTVLMRYNTLCSESSLA